MFDQPELESKQLTEQGRTKLGWLRSSEVLHGAFQTSLSTHLGKMVIPDRNGEIESYLGVWRFCDENASERFPAEPIDSDEICVIPGDRTLGHDQIPAV